MLAMMRTSHRCVLMVNVAVGVQEESTVMMCVVVVMIAVVIVVVEVAVSCDVPCVANLVGIEGTLGTATSAVVDSDSGVVLQLSPGCDIAVAEVELVAVAAAVA